jgi:hypothetical protein
MRRLRQRAAADVRPTLLGDDDDEGEPHRGDHPDDADAGAAHPHEKAVADQVGREERVQSRLSELGEHLYVHRPRREGLNTTAPTKPTFASTIR